jgi:hypothetical protein
MRFQITPVSSGMIQIKYPYYARQIRDEVVDTTEGEE